MTEGKRRSILGRLVSICVVVAYNDFLHQKNNIMLESFSGAAVFCGL